MNTEEIQGEEVTINSKIIERVLKHHISDAVGRKAKDCRWNWDKEGLVSFTIILVEEEK